MSEETKNKTSNQAEQKKVSGQTPVEILKQSFPDLYALTDYIPIRTPIRVFDFVFSALILLMSIPLLVLIILFYIVESIFSKQARGPLLVSYNASSQGKVFQKYKFRIFKMRVIDSELLQQHSYQAFPDEDFVSKQDFTLLGKFLKQTFLDEFPQLYSVLAGHISLIGPRLVPVEVLDRLRSEGHLYYLLPAGLMSDVHARKGSEEYNKTFLVYEHMRMYLTAPAYKLILRNIGTLLNGVKICLQRKGRFDRLGK